MMRGQAMTWYQVALVILVGALALLAVVTVMQWFMRWARPVPYPARITLAVVFFPFALAGSILFAAAATFALVFMGALILSMAGGEMTEWVMTDFFGEPPSDPLGPDPVPTSDAPRPTQAPTPDLTGGPTHDMRDALTRIRPTPTPGPSI